MGQCGGCSVGGKRKVPLDKFWAEPEDTEKYSMMKLPTLQFQGSLANFKIKKCPYVSVHRTQPTMSIKLQIKGVDTFYLRQKKIKEDQSAKWSFQQKLGFQKTEYELRKSFLRVEFRDEQEQVVGEMQVNLFLISTGPYHQDFAVNLRKGQNTRISFDMKISQIIQIQVQSILAEVDLITKHPGEKFMFSIKTIVGHNFNLNSNSSPSYRVRVMLDNKEKQNQSSSSGSEQPTSNPQKQIQQGNNLVWKKEDYLPMPSVTMKILVSEIHHSIFQILLWKIDDKCTGIKKTQKQQLYGECYVALHKLFDKDPKLIEIDGKEMEEHIIESNDKVWHHGKKIGMASFKFNIRNQTYVKQMQVCVRTEEGIQKYSPVFQEKEKSDSLCPELIEITNISEEIQSKIISLDKLQSMPTVPNVQSRKLKVSIEKNLQKIIELLQKSSKESIIFYTYSSEKELLKAHKIFIDLGLKTLNYLEEEDVLINEQCWQILIALIKRGQFHLAHIGFDLKEKDKIKSKQIDKKLSNKVQVAIMYKQFLYKLLDLALKALNVKGLDYERDFAEIFCAHAYFRIPHFRAKVLQAIVKEDDPQILEQRGIQFGLQDDINYDELIQELNTFTVLFDWGDSFHKCIEHEEKSQLLDNEVNQILKEQNWRKRMSKRSSAFFYFVKFWVQYIEQCAIKARDIQWKYFPGYNKLIKCFLIELKKRSIMEYPSALKEASFSLLSNDKLLNSFVFIIFHKANIYQPLTVSKAIEYINEIFTYLSTNRRKIPVTFNYGLFYKGLKIILENQFGFAITKVIILLYNHFPSFNVEFRKNLSMYFLGKIFFRLFLHWSHNVRDAFHHFLIMRIHRESLQLRHSNSSDHGNQGQNTGEIRIRYQKLMLILENALKVKEEDKSSFIPRYDNDLHKKMKKKLYEKKKKKNALDKVESLEMEKEEERKSFPESQYLTNFSVFDEKYSIKKLSKQRQTSRHHSQILNTKVQLIHAVKVPHSQAENEVKRLKTNTWDFRHQIYDTTQGKRELMPNQVNHFDQGDFQIERILPQMVEYLPAAMKEFRKINQIFSEHTKNKRWEAPQIQISMPLDGKQIKPQKIDDW